MSGPGSPINAPSPIPTDPVDDSFITKIMKYIKSIKKTTLVMIIATIIAILLGIYLKMNGKLSFFGGNSSTPVTELLQ